MLDADHVPMPDALDALVGYFDDERMALVQTPHDFFNHDSVQHYVVGRHEQSLFYRVVCPGKDRHGAAYWCGSAALIRRQALLEIGGVATETIAEDFHTTIRTAAPRLDAAATTTRSWSRAWPRTTSTATCCSATAGRAATSPSSPCPSPPCAPASCARCSASPTSPASLAYLAPPMRLLLLADPGAGAVDRRAADEDQRRRAGGAVAALGERSTSAPARRWPAATCGSPRPPTTSC